MRPKIDKELQLSYGILGGVVLLGAIALALYYDWGERSERLETVRNTYESRNDRGALAMSDQVAALQRANERLAGSIEGLKERVGLREVTPFVLPTETTKFGLRFTRLYGQVRDQLRLRARNQNIKFDDHMGFKYLDGKPPLPDETRTHLIMLQLITKAVYLALHTPENEIQAVEVPTLNMRRDIRLAGPAARPTPLIREYHFTVEVEGTLRELLWLLHRLSVDQPETEQHEQFKRWLADITEAVLTPAEIARLSSDRTVGNEVSPLVVTDCRILSENFSQYDGLSQLRMRLDLAGMEFLGPEVQWEQRGDRRGSSRQPLRPPPAVGTPSSSKRRPPIARP